MSPFFGHFEPGEEPKGRTSAQWPPGSFAALRMTERGSRGGEQSLPAAGRRSSHQLAELLCRGLERDEVVQVHRLVALDRFDAGDADENGGGALLVSGEAPERVGRGALRAEEGAIEDLIRAAVGAGDD